MVGIGTGLALLGAIFLYVGGASGGCRPQWFFRAVMVAGPAAFVALICGWIATEVGRQPWIVYEVMRTEEAVTQADGLESATSCWSPSTSRSRRGRLAAAAAHAQARGRRWLRSAPAS